MMSSLLTTAVNAPQPYPRRCAACGEDTVEAASIENDAKIKHDGRLYELHISHLPVDRCSSCSEVFFTNATSDAKAYALRQHLGLLQPEELRSLLTQHHLTQRSLAQHLHVAEELISRWVNGLSIQSRALDTFLRVYFDFPQVRTQLAEKSARTVAGRD